MITAALQQLAGLFSRRFFFNALLPTFVFTTAALSTVIAYCYPIAFSATKWEAMDLLVRLALLFVYIALVYLLSAAVASQWRNIVRLFEGYPLVSVADKLSVEPIGRLWHQEKMDRLLSDEEGNETIAYYRYPLRHHRNKVLPTRLGNIMLAGERYSADRYGIDTIYFWSRLFPLLPDTFQRDYELAVIQYQFPLVVSFETSIATVVCCAALIYGHATPLPFLAFLLGGFLMAYSAYTLSLMSAVEMAELQRSAFDLFRGRLLTAWPSVHDVRDERVAFRKIESFVVQNARPNWESAQTAHLARSRRTQEPPA